MNTTKKSSESIEKRHDLIPMPIAQMMVMCFVNTSRLEQAERLLQDARLVEEGDNLHYELGLAFAQQGQLDEALSHFRTLRERRPEEIRNSQAAIEALCVQAGQRINQQDWTGAQQALVEALTFSPHDKQLQRYLGAVQEGLPVFYLSQNRRDEAAELWEQVQRTDPTNYRVAQQLAILYHCWAIEREEADDTRTADRLWPKALANWVLLAEADTFWAEWPKKRADIYGMPLEDKDINLLREKGLRERLEEIQRDFVTAYTQTKDSKNVERHKEYRSLLDLEFKTAKALKETANLLRQRNQAVSVPICAGPVMLNQLGLLEAAKKMVDQAQKLDPQAEAPKNLADYLSSLGRLHLLVEKQQTDLAVDELKRVIQREPHNVEARRLLGRALKDAGEEWIKSGEVEKAVAAWAEGLTYDQSNAEFKELIGRACVKKATELDRAGHLDEAINILKLGLDHVPDRRELHEKLADDLNRRGVVYAKRKEWEQAINDMQQALSYDPNNRQVKANLAQVQQAWQKEINQLLEVGRPDLAIPILKQALQAQPNNTELKQLIALACNLQSVKLTNQAAAVQNQVEKCRLLNETQAVLELGLQHQPGDQTLKANLAAVHQIKARLRC